MTATNRTCLLLFLLFQSLYALTSSGNAFRIPDEFEVYFQVEHLVDAGDLSVPQAVAIRRPVVENGRVVGMQSVFFGKVGTDSKPYAPYGPLAAVLSLPHHLAGRVLARVTGVPRAEAGKGLAWVLVVGGVTMLVTATGAALAVAGFYRAVSPSALPPTAVSVVVARRRHRAVAMRSNAVLGSIAGRGIGVGRGVSARSETGCGQSARARDRRGAVDRCCRSYQSHGAGIRPGVCRGRAVGSVALDPDPSQRGRDAGARNRIRDGRAPGLERLSFQLAV